MIESPTLKTPTHPPATTNSHHLPLSQTKATGENGNYGGAGFCYLDESETDWAGCEYCDENVMCTDGTQGGAAAGTDCVFPFTYVSPHATC